MITEGISMRKYRMKKYNLKQKMAAMLCMAMLCSCVTPAAFAEATPDEHGGDAPFETLLEQSTDVQPGEPQQKDKPGKKAEKEDKKAEKKAKEEAAAQKKLEEEAAAKKKLEEEAAAKKKLEEEAAAQKKLEKEVVAQKKLEEEAAAQKKLEEEAAAQKKLEEEAAAQKKLEEEAAAQKKLEEEAAAQKKLEEEAAAKKKAEEDAKKAEKEAKKAEKEEKKAEKDAKKTEEEINKAEEEVKNAQEDAAPNSGIATADESQNPQTLPWFGGVAISSDGITTASAYGEDCTTSTSGDGRISGVVSFFGTRDALVFVFDADGNEVKRTSIDANENGDTVSSDFVIRDMPVGVYTVNFYLEGDISQGLHSGPRETVTATVGVSKTIAQIKAEAEGGNNRVDVTITEGSDEPIKVTLLLGSDVKSTKTIAAGSRKASFEGLAAGTYRVIVDYETQQDSNPVFIENIPVTNARAAIDITSVREGEKILTVKGTAQAGAAIQVQTVPATEKAAMVVGNNGTFEWVLAAEPNTYTQVKVFYANDESSGDVMTGSWTVTAPTTAPTITVDPVNNHSTTVVVKTGANLTVLLTVPDGTLTATSNENGLAHFSLTHKYLKGEEFTVTVVYGTGSGQIVSKKVTVGGVTEYTDLEQGDYGEAVLRLTTRLNQLGYPIAPTKDYNSAVREAVRLFQIANGQEADGEAGDRMQAALYSVSAIRYGSGRYPTLVRGDEGLALIKTLQQRLKDLGYYTIKVDGIFGSGTQRAVRLFQQVNGLPDTGIADNATQVLLYSSAAKPLGYGQSGSYSTLQRSSKYKSAVVPLQRRLRELGYYTGSIDGYFGSKTYRAVRNFQSRNGLKVTGVADPLTQQVLHSAAAKKYNGSTAGSSSGSSLGYRLLYWGCRGEEVSRLQSALISAGYKNYVRSVDGIFGQWTYDGVCAYQRDHGLTVDGIAGKKTQNSLYGTNY